MGRPTVTTTEDSARFDGDTSREALRAQSAAVRRISPARRLALMDDVTRLARSVSREGVRRRHPGVSEDALDALCFELALGKDLAARVLEHRRARPAGQTP